MPLSSRTKQIALACGLFVLFILCAHIISAPSDFPQSTVITIEPGETLNNVTRQLRMAGAIRSSSTFQTLAIIFGGEHKIIAGDYLLDKRQTAVILAWRVIHGDFDQTEIKVTIPEGFSNQQIGDVLSEKLPTFDESAFLALAIDDQGYLFPDTYFFEPTATSSEIIGQMKENFDVHIALFETAIAASGYSRSDIIIMASILEAEATSTADKQIVAGILWKRLADNIALEIDSDPDTYKTLGLPVQPIDNPGVDSINAALHPTATDYLYYLTGNDGVMHYATTFAEHQANIRKYLK